MLAVVAVGIFCATCAWVAWLWRPRRLFDRPEQLGKWATDHDVQAARFVRGDVVEIVMVEKRPAEDAPEERADREDNGLHSPLDQALELMTSGSKRRRQDEAS